jgi:hypothetical protein
LSAVQELLGLARTLLPGVLVPAAVTTVVLLAARWSGLAAGPKGDRLAGAVALGAGFAAARFVLEWLRWQPEDPWDWLPYLVLLVAAAGLIDPGPPARLLKWPVRLAVAAAAAWVLAPDVPGMEPARPVCLAVTGAAVFLLWSLLDPPAARQPGALVPGLLALAIGAAGAVLEGAGFMKLVELALALTGVLTACAGCSPGRRPRAYARGMVPGVAVVLPGLMLNGYLNNFGGAPPISFVLALVAPLGLWVDAVPALRYAKGWWRVLVPCAAVLLPAALAAGLAMAASGE